MLLIIEHRQLAIEGATILASEQARCGRGQGPGLCLDQKVNLDEVSREMVSGKGEAGASGDDKIELDSAGMASQGRE